MARHAVPKSPSRLRSVKRVVARTMPYVGAVAIVVPIWAAVADEDTPPQILAMKTAVAAGALKKTLDELESRGLIPTWLDTNPDNDDD